MNFKKCTSLLLAFLLLVSNAGLAFNVHYCGGKVASVTSVFHSKSVCDMQIPVNKALSAEKIIENKDKCCSDKVVNFKKSNDVIVKAFSFETVAPFVILVLKPIVFTPVSFSEQQQTTAYYCDANAPPLFKLYSQYIFYA